jgi:sigma-B regulation protein RsbU (phosphoserine phosphatase)
MPKENESGAALKPMARVETSGVETPAGQTPLEGDYRPAATRALLHAHASEPNIRVEPLQLDFLMRLADALNTTLDLNTLLHRVADLVRAVIDYRIFAILLINDRTHELWMRFQSGHTPDVERIRVKLGRGVTGQAALHRKSILVEDVTQIENYINANAAVRSELAVPLIVKNRVIGVLDLQSEALGFFTDDHRRLLELTASRVGIAVENARLYTRVSKQAQTLTVLHEISREISSILDPDDLLERIGALLKRVIDFQMFTILLWNERAERFEHRFSTRYGERVTRAREVALGQGLIGAAAQDRAPVLSPDVRKDARYLNENPETRSELSVPLIYKGKVIGVIDLEHTRVNYYTEDHQRTLTTLAAQISVSIANARLYQRIHEEEQRMERDLEMAREVQLRLMPSAPPRFRNAEIATSFRPARSIGGDIYDFLDYGRDSTLIVLGDVSGKAAPAALYAALVSGVLRSLGPRRFQPEVLLSMLNEQLQERKLSGQYVTMVVALWDDADRMLHVANAGFVQPLVVTRQDSETEAIRVRNVPAEGFPLGLFPSADYEAISVKLVPGDTVVFCSDGIADAINSRGEDFGDSGVREVLRHNPNASRSANSTVQALMEAVTTHQAGTEHFDDETIVALRVR